MAETLLETPVALFLFNRPAETARVFAEIRRARPRRLLLIGDGPRASHPQDVERCAAARAIVEQVDWPAEVLTNFAAENLGCQARVASGLAWVFEHNPAAIILEDDCLPHPAFFPYCEELLARYADDAQVLSIAGTNLLVETPPVASYDFSRYTMIWGWASWRRAWAHYDVEMGAWPHLRELGWLEEVLGDSRAAAYWRDIFQSSVEQRHTWDYAWQFACWRAGGLTIHPGVNLVSNIGFGAQATHTTKADDTLANRPTAAIEFPLRHPAAISANVARDRKIEAKFFSGKINRLFELIRQSEQR